MSKGLHLEIQGVGIEQNLFILELGETEVVLGMDWLASLGDLKANFKSLIIRWGGKACKKVLRGDPSLTKARTS